MTKATEQLKKTYIIHGICFSLCFFCFMLAEATVNRLSIPIFGAENVNTIYCIGLIFTGAGYLLYNFLQKIISKHQRKMQVIYAFSALFILSALSILKADSAIIFILCGITLLISCGYINGCIYYYTALQLTGYHYRGRFIGLSLGIAIFLQYLVQNCGYPNLIFVISVILSILSILYFLPFALPEIIPQEIHSEKEQTADYKAGVSLILATIVMTFIASILDGIVTAQDAAGTMKLYASIRLFYGFGLLLAGIVADWKERKYFILTTVCVVFTSSICIALFHNPAYSNISVALMYTYMGFYVMFFTLYFMDYAVMTKAPALWASLGRITRSITTAIVILPAYKLYELLGLNFLSIINTLLLILLLLLLIPHIVTALSGLLNLAHTDSLTIEEQQKQKKEQAFQAYTLEYQISKKEKEVLNRLLFTQLMVVEIAEEMEISRRMVQRYIASIYEKTGTQSRTALLNHFYLYQKHGDIGDGVFCLHFCP